jgi:hypothetical protein
LGQWSHRRRGGRRSASAPTVGGPQLCGQGRRRLRRRGGLGGGVGLEGGDGLARNAVWRPHGNGQRRPRESRPAAPFFWQGDGFVDGANEAMPLALRPRGPAGRLACARDGSRCRCAGAWPPGPTARPRRPSPWARRTVNRQTEAPRLGLGSTTEFSQPPYIGAREHRRVAGKGGVPALFWSVVTPTPSSSFNPVRPFRNCKTPKSSN